jgi:hypothetical protein
MQKNVHLIPYYNDDAELLYVTNSLLLPRYRSIWTGHIFTKQVSRFFWQKL